jgi:hypothetical protein
LWGQKERMGIPRLVGKDVIYLRWSYKIKHAANGSIETYKAINYPKEREFTMMILFL